MKVAVSSNHPYAVLEGGRSECHIIPVFEKAKHWSMAAGTIQYKLALGLSGPP